MAAMRHEKLCRQQLIIRARRYHSSAAMAQRAAVAGARTPTRFLLLPGSSKHFYATGDATPRLPARRAPPFLRQASFRRRLIVAPPIAYCHR